MIKQFYLTHIWDLKRDYHSGLEGPGSNGNKEVLYIPQSFRARVLASDGLASYPGHPLAFGEDLNTL